MGSRSPLDTRLTQGTAAHTSLSTEYGVASRKSRKHSEIFSYDFFFQPPDTARTSNLEDIGGHVKYKTNPTGKTTVFYIDSLGATAGNYSNLFWPFHLGVIVGDVIPVGDHQFAFFIISFQNIMFCVMIST